MRIITCFFILFCFGNLYSQVSQFDKLEQLYDQAHFKSVYRKSKVLIDNPEFDYSLVPLYYKSISTLQLLRNDRWRKSHNEAFLSLTDAFDKIKKSNKGRLLLINHQNELSSLKLDLASWLGDLNRRKEKDLSFYYDEKIKSLFYGITDSPVNEVYNWNPPTSQQLAERVSLIEYAKQFIGVPYVWAGESPDGFDCSGFTSFVFMNKKIVLPRRAMDQYEATNKVSAEKAQIGDLVFFSNGGEISHVGILVSEIGKEKVMIHASSSKGITFDKIDGSSYWEKRLHGFGSIIK